VCPITHVCAYRAALNRLPSPMTGLADLRGRYYCKTRNHFFDQPDILTDRYGTEQICCPRCGSMNVFHTRTGRPTKKARDFRV
jgi:endonuclease-3